jgi:hypothetical protein
MNKFLMNITTLLLLSSIVQMISACQNFFSQKIGINKPQKYALIVGGGTNECDNYESFYANILYVNNVLMKLNYSDDQITVLFFGGEKSKYNKSCATKEKFIDELWKFVDIIDSNDSLLIVRSGHGTLEFIGEATIGVMNFPDGRLSSFEFMEIIKKINAKQIVIILNQCFCGQFADISINIPNVLVVSETKGTEVAVHESRKTVRWQHKEWPFIKCLFDGFLQESKLGKKTSVFESFQYMLNCNPNTKGVPIQADRPLLKEHPIITYGTGLKKGSVYIY